MAVIDQTDPHESELARAWLAPREQVLGSTERRFRRLGSGAVAAAVDQAWLELFERGQKPPDPEILRRRWLRLSYFRARDRVRDLERQPVHSMPVDELEDFVVLDRRAGASGDARSQARLEEILSQAAGEGRRWLEAVLETPDAPPRVLAARLGWEVEKVRTVARRTRGHLREFVVARESGVICERRQAVMEAFAATRLWAAAPESAESTGVLPVLSEERCEEVALHIAGCLDCERAWRRAQGRVRSRPRFALFPALFGKAAAASGSLWVAGRRLLFGLRGRVESGVGKATAGGAAGAGTAGALAGKGAVTICAGLVCATGLGASALVGLPVGALHTPAHHRSVKGGRAFGKALGAKTAETTSAAQRSYARTASANFAGSGASAPTKTNTRPSSTRKTAGPATPGDLSNLSGGTGRSSGSGAQTTATGKAASVNITSRKSPSTAPPPSSGSHGGSSACVPGTLGCG